MTESLSKPVAISAIAHVTLVLILLVKAFFAPNEAIDLREAIRVDVVGLPEKQQKLPAKATTPAVPAPPALVAKPVPKPAAPKPKAPETPKVDLGKKNLAKSEEKALNKIKAMAALEKLKTEVSKSSAKPVKGNHVNAGNSLTGLEKIDFDRYFQSVEDKIRANWSLPQWLIDAQLRAQALVLIDESGGIKKKQVLKSSGNSEFDDRMMDAIDKAAPFPAPPERLQGVLSEKGIVFNFPQRGDT